MSDRGLVDILGETDSAVSDAAEVLRREGFDVRVAKPGPDQALKKQQHEVMERLTAGAADSVQDLDKYLDQAASALSEIIEPSARIELVVQTPQLVMSTAAGASDVAEVSLQVALRGVDGSHGFLRILGSDLARRDETSSFIGLVAFAIGTTIERAMTAHDLTERSKELRALHAISQALQTTVGIGDQASALAEILAEAFQYPELTTVEVTVGDITRRAGVSGRPLTTLEAPVIRDMQTVGRVRVGYTATRDWLEPQETDLVNSSAALLGTWLANRRAEAERLQSQQLIERALATTPIGVLVMDARGRFRYANASMRDMLGLEPTDPLASFLEDRVRVETVGGGTLPDEDRAFSRVKRTADAVRDLEYVIVAANGARITVSVNASPLYDAEGKFDGVVAAYTNVTARKNAELRLARNEARLEQLLARLPAVVWTVDRELRLTSMAGAGIDRLRRAPELGERLEDYFGTGGEFAPREAYEAALAGESASAAFWWQDVWWQITLEPVRDPSGEVTAIIGVGFDSTDLALARKEADVHQVRLNALFQHTLDAIFLADDEGRYVDVNPAAAELTGRPREELLGLRAHDIAATEKREVDELYQQFRESGTQAGDFFIQRPDGEIVVAEYRAVRDILPGLHMSMLRDVTERRRMEEELLQSEARFRSIAERSWNGIFRLQVRPELRFLYVNPAMAELTGRSVKDIEDDPQVLVAKLEDEGLATLIAAFEADDDRAMHVRFERSEGDQRWLEVRLRLLRDDRGLVTEVQGVVNDVTTEREQLEALGAALERERAAGDEVRRLEDLRKAFLRAVSHELRTPLTSIYGLALTLHRNLDRVDEEMMGRMLERLGANAERMRALLDDLLDVNRLGEGRVLANKEQTDLARLVAPVVELVDIGSRTLRLETVETPAVVDTAALSRVTRELVHNVARHTPESTTVWVRTDRFEGGAMLTVEDDGPGIPEDLRDHIAEAFEQGADARAAPSPGTGIGLYLTAQFARLHGGELLVDERPGGGARFRVWLPDTAA